MNATCKAFTVLLYLFASDLLSASEYNCIVEKKFDHENTLTHKQIEDGQFSVKIKESNTDTFVSRCSFSPSVDTVTCDRYRVDKIVFDEYVKIKKYYVFRSQFDLQLLPNLSFVENNGRGGIAYGTCQITAMDVGEKNT